MSPSDQIVKIEMSKIEQFVALGLGRYEAIEAVELGVDVATVEALVTEQGSPGTVAFSVAR
jgi:hypothetical protein